MEPAPRPRSKAVTLHTDGSVSLPGPSGGWVRGSDPSRAHLAPLELDLRERVRIHVGQVSSEPLRADTLRALLAARKANLSAGPRSLSELAAVARLSESGLRAWVYAGEVPPVAAARIRRALGLA